MGTTELSAKPDEIMWGGGVGKLWWASILHSQPTPAQDAGKGPEAVRFILVCEPTGTFFFKQTETCYLPSCDFRHLKPPSDPLLVVFPPAVLQVFP